MHKLRVKEMIQETADARSFVLEPLPAAAERYIYRSGQFLTFRLLIDGQEHFRSYSMSSSPAVDALPRVTVKRVPGGVVSNWMHESLNVGDTIEATTPSGVFVLNNSERDVVAFAAGSGITPVLSILTTALATTTLRVRLLYANRDASSIIFRSQLGDAIERYGDRLDVHFHCDSDAGLIERATLDRIVDGTAGSEFFVCGPGTFMDLVEDVLSARDIDPARVHLERFVPEAPPGVPAASADSLEVTIDCGRRTATGRHHDGSTILQTARTMGLQPPSSCQIGSCGACIARVVKGRAQMRHNDALTPEEVEEGWILTCQAYPEGSGVHVAYE